MASNHRPGGPSRNVPGALAGHLRERLAVPGPLTVGVEEELMVLDAASLDLVPAGPALVGAAGGDDRVQPELPAAQVELAPPAACDVPHAAAALAAARRDLAAVAGDLGLRLAGSGLHPFAAVEGPLNPSAAYDGARARWGPVLARQLVFGLHVHVRVTGAARAVAVHDGLRPLLPLVAALAASAPHHGGRDTGMASARPLVARALPRQGVPPAIGDLDRWASGLEWAVAAGLMPSPSAWWWELRINPRLGTVEVRVPDAQRTVREVAAVAALVHALVADLAARHDAGEPVPEHPAWCIEEVRWTVSRDGVRARVPDLCTGRARWAADLLDELLARVASQARALGCAAQLDDARAMLEPGGAALRRRVAAERGMRGLAGWLADGFLEGGVPPDSGRVVPGTNAP